MSHLAALPVVVPFVAGPVLVTIGSFAPPVDRGQHRTHQRGRGGSLCAILALHTVDHPLAYWVGGLRPRQGVAIGISLSIDPLGAGLACFAALLVVAAFTYSLRYFDAIKGLFHGLMLMFMAGMVGFCLTGDLFNLVVFFELMSVSAYALTAYRIEERAPIQGAINFAITNSIAGYAMFVAIGMLYARTGALNVAEIGAALGGHPADPLVIVAMVLLFAGFLTKAAVVPLHFWLADAHAVAPVPVCVLFSGVMVELGLYAVARLYWEAFAGPLAAHTAELRAILVTFGTLTALLGAWMCFVQRHIKRLLAFSTISHVGMFVCGIGLLSVKALAGVAIYVVGHGLTKGALFMCAGVLLHRFATVDEFDLHGRGREIRIVGVLMAAGVFLGWGPSQGPDPEQARAAEERTDETRGSRDYTPVLMVVVPAVLLIAAALVGLIPGAVPAVERQAARFADHDAYARWVLGGGHVSWPVAAASHLGLADVVFALLGVLGAFGLATLGLFGRPLREGLPAPIRNPARTVVHTLRYLHTGEIGDYIAWWTTGTAVLGGVCLIALR